ncbi:MFS transporter [Amycolatopsis sp. OK19-0408]|uniref:MFS transporter n=1 Tax=Amycolatopsis iheyensis TaxID=2945988 RepID=A0A9X2NAV9_9PSEU|nr:MFS transporter [Amycolatopsis iheyensis]MCR6483858.1 MFS transporter [Amycolatopsis iheyensis]
MTAVEEPRAAAKSGSAGAGTGAAAAEPKTAVTAAGSRALPTPFLGLVLAMGLSSFGDAVWLIALSVTLVGTAGPALAGVVLALGSLPKVLTLLVGGAVADRTGPRRVLVTTDLVRAGAMLGGAAAVLLAGPSVPLLAGLIVVMAVASAFFIPASDALRPNLLPPEHLVRGNAVYLAGVRGGQAAGGALGSWLAGLGGLVTVAVVNGVSFLVSALAAGNTKTLTSNEPRERVKVRQLAKDVGEGCRYVASRPALRTAMIVTGLLELSGAGPINLGLVLLGGNRGAGWLLTAMTLGASLAFVVSVKWPPREKAGRLATAGLAAQVGCLALLATGSLVVGIAAFFTLGLVAGLTALVLVSLAQRWATPEMRGRVMSILALFTLAATPVGNLLIGVLVEAIGVPLTMLAHAAVALVALALLVATPALGRAALTEEKKP